MTENNDIELARRGRRVQALAGEIDSVMANESQDQLFRLYLKIVEEAHEAMHRMNRLKWPEKS